MAIVVITHPTMDGSNLVVNDPEHMAMRPTKRMLVPGLMDNQKGEAASEKGPSASYYTDSGCLCEAHW
jgi:hypothetical protein